MAHGETAPTDAPEAPCCLDCPAPATHGVVCTKYGLYRGMRVARGARWCKAHSMAVATRRNAPHAQAKKG